MLGLCLACKLLRKIAREIYCSMQKSTGNGSWKLWSFRHNFFGVPGPSMISIPPSCGRQIQRWKKKIYINIKNKCGSQEPPLLPRLVYVQEFVYCGYTICLSCASAPCPDQVLSSKSHAWALLLLLLSASIAISCQMYLVFPLAVCRLLLVFSDFCFAMIFSRFSTHF